MITIKIVESFGRDISSRKRAAQLRQTVCTSPAVELDFTDVRTISDSFADELFGVLVQEQGEVWFRKHVTVLNINPHVRQTVLETVADRLRVTG